MSRPYMYILVDKQPISVTDVIVWAMFMEGNRTVEKTSIGDILVSTVFLGLDHNYSPDPTAILFETMIFGGDFDDYQRRYATWEQAEHGHKDAVEMVRQRQYVDKIITNALNDETTNE